MINLNWVKTYEYVYALFKNQLGYTYMINTVVFFKMEMYSYFKHVRLERVYTWAMDVFEIRK